MRKERENIVIGYMVLVVLIVFFGVGFALFCKGLYIAAKTKCGDIDGMCYCLIGATFVNGATQILSVLLA